MLVRGALLQGARTESTHPFQTKMRPSHNDNATWLEKFPEDKGGLASCGRCSPRSSVDDLCSTKKNTGARAFEMPCATTGNALHFETRARVVDSGAMQSLDVPVERRNVSQACDALVYGEGTLAGSATAMRMPEGALKAVGEVWRAACKAQTGGSLGPSGIRGNRIAVVFRTKGEHPFGDLRSLTTRIKGGPGIVPGSSRVSADHSWPEGG